MEVSLWDGEESGTTEQLHFHFSLSCIGEGNGNPLQCSCPENPRDGVAQSRTQLSDLATAAADLGMTGAKITTLQSVEVDQLNF